MNIFSINKKFNCEEIIFKYDKKSNLRCILIIDSTKLGKKACGGVRMLGFKNEEEALRDGLKLAKAMSKKHALYDIELGGAKAVVMGNPKKDKTKEMLEAFGRFVESLGGKYWTCIDMGFTMDDAKVIASQTQFIDSVEPAIKQGSLGLSGIGTGIGVVEGMKIAIQKTFSNSDLEGIRVAVQGLGSVGSTVAELLIEEGAEVFGADYDEHNIQKAKKIGVKIISSQKLHSIECDVFSPCAVGNTINSKNYSQLNCKIICGGANNQLENYEIAKKLKKKGILYLPDFMINGGGVIQAEGEYAGTTKEEAYQNIRIRVSKMVDQILSLAEKRDKLPFEVAEEIANKKLA